MAAIYGTGALPTAADIPDMGANLSTNPHTTLHDDMRDEIVAMCAKFGVEPWGSHPTVQARITNLDGRTTSTITPASPWSGSMYTLKTGRTVHLVANVTRASVTINGGWTLGTVAAGFRPTHGQVPVSGAYQTTTAGTGIAAAVYLMVGTDGAIVVQSRVESIVAMRVTASWSV